MAIRKSSNFEGEVSGHGNDCRRVHSDTANLKTTSAGGWPATAGDRKSFKFDGLDPQAITSPAGTLQEPKLTPWVFWSVWNIL